MTAIQTLRGNEAPSGRTKDASIICKTEIMKEETANRKDSPVKLRKNIINIRETQIISRRLHCAAKVNGPIPVVRFCKAWIERKETEIFETEPTINFVTPHFRAVAHVIIPKLSTSEWITVGWIQAVTSMKFVNTYKEGSSSWEIPHLGDKTRSAISDADGRLYPWYGITTERKSFCGNEKPGITEISMNDHFSPRISWTVPVGTVQHDSLKKVERDQTLVSWLVYNNGYTREPQVLKAFIWRAEVNIKTDCSYPLGERATLLEPKFQRQPIEKNNIRIPHCAMLPPRANEAQNFVWRAENGEVLSLDWRMYTLYLNSLSGVNIPRDMCSVNTAK